MTRLVIGATVSVLAIGAAPAAAAACELPSTTKAFAQFGDNNDYFLAGGGNFERLSWFVHDAELVNGNEPFDLVPGSRSLRITEGGLATSPGMCVSALTPHLRFVAKALGQGALEVFVRQWKDGIVVNQSRTKIEADAHQSWAPSRNVSLNTEEFGKGSTAQVTVTLYARGEWLVDNVLVDPYRR